MVVLAAIAVACLYGGSGVVVIGLWTGARAGEALCVGF